MPLLIPSSPDQALGPAGQRSANQHPTPLPSLFMQNIPLVEVEVNKAMLDWSFKKISIKEESAGQKILIDLE